MLPYQLGYHPGPSVVVTVMHDKRLGLVQRHDLVADPRSCEEVARQAMAIAAREGATAVLLIAHEDGVDDSAPLSGAMLEAARAQGMGVHDRVVVRADRWYSPDCRESCCPEDGQPLPRPEDVPAVAAFVHAGVAPLPSRDALVEGVLPETDEERAHEVALHLTALGVVGRTTTFGGGPTRPVARWTDRADDVLDWWTTVLDPDPRATPVADLDDDALAWLAVSLRDVVWRDALMGILCPGTMPLLDLMGAHADAAWSVTARCPWVPDLHFEDTSEDEGGEFGFDEARFVTDSSPHDWHDEILAVRTRLGELARLLPAEATPPVLTVLAHVAWWMGDGTVAGICLERALDVDPHHRLASLMMQLLSVGVRPWDDRSSADHGAAA